MSHNNHFSNIRGKKAGVALLLAVSCLAGLILLVGYEPAQNRMPASPAVLDSLIYDEFSAFNLPGGKISEQHFEINTSFTRKVIEAELPAGLSRTYVHMELAQQLREAGFSSRGTVTFPEEDVRIDIGYDQTMLRTVKLRRDTTFHRRINPASILVYFTDPPSPEQLAELRALGEPITILLRDESPAVLKSRYEAIDDYPYLTGFWVNNSGDTPSQNFRSVANELRAVTSNPVFLSLSADPHSSGNSGNAEVTRIPAGNAVMAGEEHGRDAFDEHLRQFARRASRGEHPIMLLRAGPETLTWLEEAIYELKKGGLILTPPPLREA